MTNPVPINELLDRVAAEIAHARFGFLAVTGTLTDWHSHRYGTASAVLVTGDPPTARLTLHADKPTAQAVADTFRDIGHDPNQPATATVHGQLHLDPRWGLRLAIARIDVHQTPNPEAQPVETVATGNHRTRWPEHINVVGLIDPEHGDDARNDVLDILGDCDLTIIEHRVPVTGRTAPLRIARALDRLGLQQPDVTLLVRGGGTDIDLDVYNHPTVIAAINRHPRPLITGIGHATNTTHADHAAHTRCITPTAAASEVRAMSTI